MLLTHFKFLHLHFNDIFKHCIYFGGFHRILTVATLDHSISCGNTNNSLNTSVVNCVGHQELEDQLMRERAWPNLTDFQEEEKWGSKSYRHKSSLEYPTYSKEQSEARSTRARPLPPWSNVSLSLVLEGRRVVPHYSPYRVHDTTLRLICTDWYRISIKRRMETIESCSLDKHTWAKFLRGRK